MTTTHHTFCRICEALCGLEMDVHNGRITGVNVNLLAPDGPDSLEPESGMTRLTAIPVDVTPAAGPREPGDWSGIAPAPAGQTP